MSDAESLPAAGPDGERLADFFHRIQSVNPFIDNRINAPSTTDVDVGVIHQKAFTRLSQLAREAYAGRRGVGAVLWGEAGIGKSHLLSRLGRWAKQDNQACFVYLHNLQAAPEHLPRAVLAAVVSILTLGRDHRLVATPLFELVHGSLIEAVGYQLSHYSWPQLQRAYQSLIDRLAQNDLPGSTLVDRTVYDVLFPFYRSAYRANQGKEDGRLAALAVRWLSGQSLAPEEARLLGLPPGRQPGEPVALVDNQQIKQVLVALTRLAASRHRPFLLAFDQVDNLDVEQAAALSRFLEALIDSSPNLLVITAGVQATLVEWHEQRVIQQSAWDRLAQEEVALQRLGTEQALQIIRARLESFLAPFADLVAVARQRQADALFPLGEGWRQWFFRDRVEVRPRDAVNWAREAGAGNRTPWRTTAARPGWPAGRRSLSRTSPPHRQPTRRSARPSNARSRSGCRRLSPSSSSTPRPCRPARSTWRDSCMPSSPSAVRRGTCTASGRSTAIRHRAPAPGPPTTCPSASGVRAKALTRGPGWSLSRRSTRSPWPASSGACWTTLARWTGRCW
jgi:hypothetical protein